MILNELGYLGDLTVIQDTPVLENRITIALDKELGRTALSEFTVTSMDVHALHHTERRKIKIISCHFEIVVFWHISVLHVFFVLLQIATRNRKFDIVHCCLQHFSI